MNSDVETFIGLTQTAWTGIYTLITFGLLTMAVVAAIYAARQWKDARKAHKETNRPYVIVVIEPSPASPQLFDLVVRNIGKRPAKNVSITLYPPPERASETAGHELRNIKMLNEPVAMIAPEQELRTFFDNSIERTDERGLPTSHTVSLTYFDSSNEVYEEASILDLEALKGTMFTTVHSIHSLGKSLQNISKTLQNASVLKRRGLVESNVSVNSFPEKEIHKAQESDNENSGITELIARLGFRDEARRLFGPSAPEASGQD
ncbi:hypothetical protein [Glutamicibacter sp. NPDC087344]|uniref:hypothetical protein n=1 Tax=Glutamicibacter sp. NPDC087344 TaxID=3363994 RepID=UPI0037F4731F